MIEESQKTKLLAKYEYSVSNAARRTMLISYVRHFLDNCEGLDKPALDEYFASLSRKYAPATVNGRFRAVARMFRVNGLPWEYKRGEGPQIAERDEYRPEFSPEAIQAMIEAAKTGKLLPDESCFLALSTTYGLRAIEIHNLKSQDFDYKNDSFYVATAKRGRARYHLIAPEIKPYLQAHDFNARYGMATLNVIMKRILFKSCHDIPPKARWHAIRRAIVTGLVRNGVPLLDVIKFLRWRGMMGDLAMPARYFGNVIVGFGEPRTVISEAGSDRAIFEKHPFLPFWR